MINEKNLHIVQTSSDDSVFEPDGYSDTSFRQLMYGREIAKRHPLSVLTLIIHTENSEYKKLEMENVVFIPLYGSGPLKHIKLLKELITINRNRPISAVATQDIFEDAWVTMFFSIFHKCKIIGQIHSDIFSKVALEELLGKGWRCAVKAWLAKKTLKNCTTIRTVGQGIKQKMMMQNMHKNIYVIPVPISMILTENGEDAIFRKGNAAVLFVGTLTKRKNLKRWIDVAVEVFRELPDTKFLIAGDGPEKANLEIMAGQKGIKNAVSFLGYVPYKNLKALYKKSDVFLITSLSEGFGRVVAEAGYNGLPTVAPRIIGVEDIVKHGKTGFLCEPENAKEMAEKVICLLKDGHLKSQMGKNAKVFVKQRFDPQSLVTQWVDLLLK